MYDLIIIGGSAVGCSAAIYAARRKLNFKIISKDIGGEVALSGETNNWPSVVSIQGYDLSQKFAEHVKSYGVIIEEGWTVENIIPNKNYHTIVAKNQQGKTEKLQTKTIIIGSGIHPRRLGIPGEDTFDRKGVTSCTVCDGPLFKNKDTVTIGSGNSALESVLMMAGIAKTAYIISKYPEKNEDGFPKGDRILVDKIKILPNVKIIYQAKTLEIIGTNQVAGVTYNDVKEKKHELAVQAVMVHIGMIPNTQFAGAIAMNKQKEIIVDKFCHTNIPGIYAAGDVTDNPHKQIGIAVGHGITAALEAIGYVNIWKP